MARYIDADALIEELKSLSITVTGFRGDKGYLSQIVEEYKNSILRIIDEQPTADVVPKSEEGAECPTCHGTGRIGTTDWLTKGLSKKQLAEEKAKALAEHEQHIKTEVAREIFEEIEKIIASHGITIGLVFDEANGADTAIGRIDKMIAELKKKYTEEK